MSPMPGRRPLLRSTQPSSIERAVRDHGRRIRKIERAPTRQVFTATPVAPKVIPASTVVNDLLIAYVYDETTTSGIFCVLQSTGDWAALSGADPLGAAEQVGLLKTVGDSIWAWAFVSDSLWRSDDGGITWADKSPASVTGAQRPIDGCAADGKLYALRFSGGLSIVVSSTDNGENWTDEFTFGANVVAAAISVSDVDSDLVVVNALIDTGGTPKVRFYHSEDAANSFATAGDIFSGEEEAWQPGNLDCIYGDDGTVWFAYHAADAPGTWWLISTPDITDDGEYVFDAWFSSSNDVGNYLARNKTKVFFWENDVGVSVPNLIAPSDGLITVSPTPSDPYPFTDVFYDEVSDTLYVAPATKLVSPFTDQTTDQVYSLTPAVDGSTWVDKSSNILSAAGFDQAYVQGFAKP